MVNNIIMSAGDSLLRYANVVNLTFWMNSAKTMISATTVSRFLSVFVYTFWLYILSVLIVAFIVYTNAPVI